MQRLRERYDAVPESVPHARHVVKEYVRGLGADSACLEAVQVGVAEAVSNAARHAYPNSTGTFELSVAPDGQGGLEVVVRDDGCGHDSVSVNPGAGFGIPLMQDATSQFTIEATSSGGTEVRMSFPLRSI